MDQILNYIDSNQSKFVQRLRDHVEIASVSGKFKTAEKV